jgi:hypothetical protein
MDAAGESRDGDPPSGHMFLQVCQCRNRRTYEETFLTFSDKELVFGTGRVSEGIVRLDHGHDASKRRAAKLAPRRVARRWW